MRKLSLTRLLSLAVAAMSLLPAVAQPASPADILADFPDVRLPARARGEAAIAALGRQLPAVAAFYGKSEQQLRNLLRRDKHLWVDPRGRLFYVCDWGGAPSEPAAALGPALAVAPFPDEQTFSLHSRPGAGKSIYLDFDGFDASGTSWGSDAIGRPFDLDSDPSFFSPSERSAVQYIWQRVAEDYAMYDLDVTTEEPGVEALRKSNTGDTNYGIRVVIGGSSSDWYGSAGGVAYVGSFNWSSDTPCWVWPGSLSNSEKNIAEAASHEAGHTLGLSHDGKDVNGNHTEYYAGQGYWAPIMGVGYSKPITQWSRGEYANANNTEDDLAVMLSRGPAYRSDDHGNSVAFATPLAGLAFQFPGNIERNTDIDFFSFQTGAGRVSLTATPAPRGANLHFLVSLFDSTGNLMTSANPGDTSTGVQPASLSVLLAAGTYYVSVEGLGSGDPVTTGYSDYASIGEYTLSGTLPSDSAWLPTAPGTDYAWPNTANWASNTLPLGPNAMARLNNNILGAQTISLNRVITLGQLLVGDADASHAFTLQGGPGGSLVFDSVAGGAQLVKTSGADDTISAPILLQTDLTITNTTARNLMLAGALAGNGSLAKAGAGNLTLTAPNAYTGATRVLGGTLALRAGTSLASTALDVGPGALLDATALSGGLVLGSNQNLNGSGAVAGNVTVAAGAQLAPGGAAAPGTLTINGNLTFNAGARLNLDLASATVPGSGTNDLIVINGDLALTGDITVDFSFLDNLPASPATYTLIAYSGAFSGSIANFVAVNPANRFAFVFDNSVPGEIRVQVSGNPVDLVWQGDGSQNRWEVAGSLNWENGGSPADFYELDSVSFDDTGLNSPSVNLVGTLRPLTVSVNSAQDYTFSGSGSLGGRASLIKGGAGVLTVSTPNNYTGPTVVNGGTLRAGHNSAFGNAAGTLAVNSGATLDLNAFSLGSKPVTVAGTGVGGTGALVNRGAAAQTNALQSVSLAGDTTFGGNSRWDLRGNPATLAGNNFNLVKTGTNEVWLVDAGPTGLANITVNQGLLGFQGSTTLGDTIRMLTIAANANVGIWNSDNNVLNKRLVMYGGGLHSLAGNNVLAGTVILSGSNVVSASSLFALQGIISGPGSLTKLGSGTLALAGANSYNGTTWVSAGTLQVRNAAALGSASGGTTIASGARLDLMGINLGAETVTVQGDGLGNAGAIVNTGGSQLNALRFVILAGNTAFGGINRWDIRANPTGALTGNNYALTKTGRNEIWLADLGQTGLGSITIKEGLLGFRGTSTMGNPASSITVNSAGNLGFYANEANVLSKVLTLSGGRVYNGNGNNTFAGSVTLSSSNAFDVASSTRLVLSGVISGSGSLNKLSAGTLVLAANNTYSGATRVLSGTLQVGNGPTAGTLGAGAVVNNATLTFHRNGTLSVPNAFSGTGTLHLGVVDPANSYLGNTLLLTGTNACSGNTVINGNGNLLAAATDFALGTGVLVFNGNNNGNSVAGIRSANTFTRTFTNNLQLGGCNFFQFGTPGTGDLVFNGPIVTTDTADKTLMVSNSTSTINNAIGNNSGLLKTGPGTLVLGGNNTNGALVINQGTVRVDAENRLGRNPAGFTAGQLTLNGGVLQTTASFALDDPNRGVMLGSSGGTFDVNPGTTLTLANVTSGLGSLTKAGNGTLVLTAANTWSGGMTVLAGTLLVNGKVQGGPVQVVGGVLGGNGTFTAAVQVQPGATLSPGTSLGALTISNTLVLAGTAFFELNKSLGTNDLLGGLTSVTFGGTLNLTNLAGTLAAGDSFKLFDAAVYTGAFASLTPSTPGPWLAWDTSRLALDGTLRVMARPPQFNPPLLVDGSLLLSGSGGEPGATFFVLASTNLGLPLADWLVVATNFFGPGGGFSFTQAMDPALPYRFYLMESQ